MRQILSYLLFTVALCCFGESRMLAQTTIHGTVTSPEGDQLIGASVTLLQSGMLLNPTVTDFNGAYKFSAPPAMYSLVVRYVGYKTYRKDSLVLVLNESLTHHVQLVTNGELEEVIVTGYKVDPMRVDETSQGTTLTSDDIKQLGTSNIAAISAVGAGATHNDSYTKGQTRSSLKTAPHHIIDGVRVTGSNAPGSVVLSHQESTAVNANESYGQFKENVFLLPEQEPLSTFGADVDVASYANMRRMINAGQRPVRDAIRTEELINYFDYDYLAPSGKTPVAFTTELGDCPWNKEHKLLHVGLQARDLPIDQVPASNLTFLIDVSGSMSSPDKLPLLKEGFNLLVNQLRPQDKVSIVVYAGAAGLVLEPTAGDEKEKILGALHNLQAGGSTAGAAGIKLAYKLATDNFIEGGNNRIILATDGDFNVGTTDNETLETYVDRKRDTNVAISVLGFGTGNYQDSRMQVIAENGNGNAAYIDNLLEAQKVFVKEFGGTLYTVAKDVKLQVEFNPNLVASYRLIGYESRLLAAQDFNDDTKDAGDMGSGHSVTALYEIIPVGAKSSFLPSIEPLKYQNLLNGKPRTGSNGDSGEWATVRMKYKHPDATQSVDKVEVTVTGKSTAFAKTSENFRWSAAVAGWSLLLKQSEYLGDKFDYAQILSAAKGARTIDTEGYRAECIRLMEATRDMGLEPELVTGR